MIMRPGGREPRAADEARTRRERACACLALLMLITGAWASAQSSPTSSLPPMLGDFFGGLPSDPKAVSTSERFANFDGGQFSGGFGGGSAQFGGGSGFGGGIGGGSNFGGGFSGFCQFGCAVPVARGSAKVAENESPVPSTRVFATYNYYDNHEGVSNVQRETVGGEWAFAGERASVGVRVPFFQASLRDADFSDHQVGDMSLLFKYALTPRTSNAVISVGAVVTLPTASTPTLGLADGTTVHPTLFQPYLGYAWRWPQFFVQGFSSVMVPSDSRDVTILFDDVGIGFQPASRASWVVPMLELHVNTPLTDRDATEALHYRDSIDFTAGAHLNIRPRWSAAFGVGVPLKPRTSPRLFDVEALAHLNVRFGR